LDLFYCKFSAPELYYLMYLGLHHILFSVCQHNHLRGLICVSDFGHWNYLGN